MDFPKRMKRARVAAGLSLVEAAYRIRQWLPEADWVGYDVIRRIEAGSTAEAKADPLLIHALAKAYGVEVADLSPEAESGIEKIRELVQLMMWIGDPGALTCTSAA